MVQFSLFSPRLVYLHMSAQVLIKPTFEAGPLSHWLQISLLGAIACLYSNYSTDGWQRASAFFGDGCSWVSLPFNITRDCPPSLPILKGIALISLLKYKGIALPPLYYKW